MTRSANLPHMHGAVARQLGIAIVRGTYPPGHLFPREDIFSAELGVGRGVYREAVRALAAKGLVECRSKAGTRVLPRARWNFLDPDVIGWFFSGQPPADLIRNLQEMRLIVEPAAAEQAARMRDAASLKEMEEALEAMRTTPFGSEVGLEAGSRFHRAVLAATGNEVLLSMSPTIDAAVRWTLGSLRQRAHENPFVDHLRLLRAIQAGDTAAARDVMRQIVVTASADLLSQCA